MNDYITEYPDDYSWTLLNWLDDKSSTVFAQHGKRIDQLIGLIVLDNEVCMYGYRNNYPRGLYQYESPKYGYDWTNVVHYKVDQLADALNVLSRNINLEDWDSDKMEPMILVVRDHRPDDKRIIIVHEITNETLLELKLML